MPRDSNGNYTLPAGNPVVTGEVISTGWANPTMSDIGAELTNSLDRQGRGGMLAPFKFVDGTNSQPGMTWTNEPTTGFYRAAGADMRATVAGVARMRWTSTGVDVYDTVAGTWVALSNASGINFAVLNAINKFTQNQVIQNASAALVLYKDATPTKAGRLAFNTLSPDQIGIDYFNGTEWTQLLAGDVSTTKVLAGGTLEIFTAGTQRAYFSGNQFWQMSGGSIGVLSGDNVYNMAFSVIGSSGYLSGNVGDITHQVGGSNALTVSGAAVSVLGDRTFRLYNPANTDYTYLKYNSANNIEFVASNPSTRWDWYLSGTSDWIASLSQESLTIKRQVDGWAAVRIQQNSANITAEHGSSLEFYEGGTLVGWVRSYRDGTGKMGMRNTANASLFISTPGDIEFYAQNELVASVGSGAINMYGARPVRYYGGGNVTYAGLYNDASSGKAVLKVQTNAGGRGGVLHWESTGLYDSTIAIMTSTPGATGTPGVMVLVYE